MEHVLAAVALRRCHRLSVPYRSGKSMEPRRCCAGKRPSCSFSPLPLGEVDGTTPRCTGARSALTIFQSPTARGSRWNLAARSAPAPCSRLLSVPYRSGKSMEPGSATAMPSTRSLSVPYRSGKSMERLILRILSNQTYGCHAARCAVVSGPQCTSEVQFANQFDCGMTALVARCTAR